MKGCNFKYIVLEKAKPYTRIKRGKVERVRGYAGRPKKTRFDIALDKHRPDVRMALTIAEEVKKHRGRALIVGGFVRDVLMNRKSKDLDIEVYGISADKLNKILSKIGKVDAVGASFGVLKVRNNKMLEPLDVSLPRHDNLVGVGHRGFVVETDKGMTPTEAAKRRDLTINSMAYDPLKKLLIDPFGGAADIKMKKLKATDVTHFAEDPLRVLRVMQFAGRFGFTPDAELVKLSRSIDLRSLPKERLYTEFEKLLLKSKQPSKGLIFMPILGVTKLFPELERLMGTPQDPESHPEGDAWEHTLMVVDAAREFLDKFEGKDKIILMLAALLHDVGKPDSTEMREDWEKRQEFENKYYKKADKNKIIAYGHQNIGVPIAEEFLRKITDDAEIIDKVKNLVHLHMAPHDLYREQSEAGVRRLAMKVNIPMLLALTSADKIGRGKHHQLQSESWLLGKYKELMLDKPETLKPLVMGRHLIELGVKPGKEMGRILDTLYNAQLEGKFKTTEEGLAYMKEHKIDIKKPFEFVISGNRGITVLEEEVMKSGEEGMKYIILKKAVNPGLVAKKVSVQNKKSPYQAMRWTRPGEAQKGKEPKRPDSGGQKKEIPKVRQADQQLPNGALPMRPTVEQKKVGDRFLYQGRTVKVTHAGKDGVTAWDADGQKYKLFHEDTMEETIQREQEQQGKAWKNAEEKDATGKRPLGMSKEGATDEVPKQFKDYVGFMGQGRGEGWTIGQPEVVDDTKGKIGIDLPFVDNKGKRFGHFEAEFDETTNQVHLKSLFLAKHWQGQGIGTDMMHQGIEYAKKKGYEKAKLVANGSSGVYAWSIQGFDWDNKSAKEIKDEFVKWVEKKHGEKVDPNILKHPWNIASYKIGDDKVGKKWMLGPGHNLWFDSTLDLKDEKSPSWKLFKKYQELRGAKKKAATEGAETV